MCWGSINHDQGQLRDDLAQAVRTGNDDFRVNSLTDRLLSVRHARIKREASFIFIEGWFASTPLLIVKTTGSIVLPAINGLFTQILGLSVTDASLGKIFSTC